MDKKELMNQLEYLIALGKALIAAKIYTDVENTNISYQVIVYKNSLNLIKKLS